MSEAIDITSIGRSHGRLTGPIFLRAVDQLHLLEFHSTRSKDWPVNRERFIRSSAAYYRSVYGAVERVRDLIAAGKLTIPVLSVSGQASFGEGQTGFAEAFANKIVKHVVIPDSGHFVAEEQPEALVAECSSSVTDGALTPALSLPETDRAQPAPPSSTIDNTSSQALV
jgi:pimeloyl-ACP methyl ester carboxylesterase